MIGSALYSYRHNFNCKKGSTKIPKKKKVVLKLVDLLRPGYRLISSYDDDIFISICQWIMRKGYPLGLNVSHKDESVDKFLQDALFSVNPYHAENLFINKNNFYLNKWREQFDLFIDTEISGLNFYRNRASMPLPNFSSFDDIKRILFTNFGKHNETEDKLGYSPNSSWPDAIVIFSKYIHVNADYFTYIISFGCPEDAPPVKGGSCWDININSSKNENYIDFCLRLHDNYDKIISGDHSDILAFTDGGERCRHYYLIEESSDTDERSVANQAQ